MASREIIRLPTPERETPEQRAAMTVICSYTKAIKINSGTNSKTDFGSGILIEMGNRLFVATARHIIQELPLVVLSPEFSFPCDPTPVIRSGEHPNPEDRWDIGFLEIEKTNGVSGLPLECLSAEPPPLPPDPRNPVPPYYWITGNPVYEAEQYPGGRLDLFNLRTKAFGTFPIHVAEDRHVYLLPDTLVRHLTVPVERKVTTTPEGYSGGGVWSFTEPPPGRVITAKNLAKLFAIQSQYRIGPQHAYAFPIKNWIAFVFDKCSDLRELLAHQFPFLRL
jgi:hypothetical protein